MTRFVTIAVVLVLTGAAAGAQNTTPLTPQQKQDLSGYNFKGAETALQAQSNNPAAKQQSLTPIPAIPVPKLSVPPIVSSIPAGQSSQSTASTETLSVSRWSLRFTTRRYTAITRCSGSLFQRQYLAQSIHPLQSAPHHPLPVALFTRSRQASAIHPVTSLTVLRFLTSTCRPTRRRRSPNGWPSYSASMSLTSSTTPALAILEPRRRPPAQASV